MNKQEEISKLFERFNDKLISENIHLSKEEVLNKLHEISLGGKYIMWVMTRYISGGIQRYEDMGRVQDCLSAYNSYSTDITLRFVNLMSIKLLSDLEALLMPFLKLKKQKEIDKMNKEKIWQEIDVIYEGPEGRIYVPKTKEASIFLGQGTRWCTASMNNNMFQEYNEQGRLYIFVLAEKDKKGRELKYQLHPNSQQFMDSQDIEVTDIDNEFKKLLTKFLIILNEKNEDAGISFSLVLKTYGVEKNILSNIIVFIEKLFILWPVLAFLYYPCIFLYMKDGFRTEDIFTLFLVSLFSLWAKVFGLSYVIYGDAPMKISGVPLFICGTLYYYFYSFYDVYLEISGFLIAFLIFGFIKLVETKEKQIMKNYFQHIQTVNLASNIN